jgi:hypothetical protein
VLFLKKTIDKNVIGGHSDKYFICNQIETYGTNFDYVISLEIDKDDWYKIKSFQENRYKQNQDVLKNSLDFARILISNVRERKEKGNRIFDKEETKMMKKPDDVYEMELKMIGNDEILEYLRESLQNIINFIESDDNQSTIDRIFNKYLVHFLNSLRETTVIDEDIIEVLFYDDESSKDLILNDYYLTFLLLNGITSYFKEHKLNINNDVLLKFLVVGEDEYENLIYSFLN